MVKVDLTGKRIGKLVVIEFSHESPTSRYVKYWKCKCDCGNTTIVRASHLYNKAINSCGCLKRRTGKNHPCFGGYEEISGDLMHSIRAGAKMRHHKCSVTMKYLWELFLKQDRKCALSGVPLSFEGKTMENRYASTSKKTASLDRIDSTKGYIKGNVQWVHKIVNLMKQTTNQDEFIEWCRKVAEHRNGELTAAL